MPRAVTEHGAMVAAGVLDAPPVLRVDANFVYAGSVDGIMPVERNLFNDSGLDGNS